MSNRKSSFVLSALMLAACGSGGMGLESAGSGMAFSTTTVPDGEVGVAYAATLSVLGGSGNYSWGVANGELPPGIVLDTSSAQPEASLVGIPEAAGAYDFTISVQSDGDAVVQSFQMDVKQSESGLGGWTTFAPGPTSRVIHVSSSGDDSAPGTESAPKRTLAAGYAQLRSGYPDWLLLKRGDAFPLTTSWLWNKCGPNVGSEWMRFGSYGDAAEPRPILSMIEGGGFALTPGYQSSTVMCRIAITDIHFLAQGRLEASQTTNWNPTGLQMVAAQWQGTGKAFSDILVENCRFSGFNFGIVSGGDVERLSLRRNVFDHIFGANTSHSSAVLGGASEWLMEDNVFYRVMSPDIPGLGGNAFSGFSHSVYVTTVAQNVVARRNIFIKASDPVMMRAGGVYSQNVTVGCNVAGNVGQAWGVAPVTGGVAASIVDNLCLNTIGSQFFLGNIASGFVGSNLLLEDLDGQGTTNFNLVALNNTGMGINIGVHNTAFEGNVLSGNIAWNPADTASFSGLTFQANQEGVGLTSASVGGYLNSIGLLGNNIDDWAAHLLRRDRGNFVSSHLATSIINYYRSHYAMTPLN